MAHDYGSPPARIRVSAGTAFKAGFFGALGVFVLSLVLTVVLGILALIAAAIGLLPVVGQLFQR